MQERIEQQIVSVCRQEQVVADADDADALGRADQGVPPEAAVILVADLHAAEGAVVVQRDRDGHVFFARHATVALDESLQCVAVGGIPLHPICLSAHWCQHQYRLVGPQIEALRLWYLLQQLYYRGIAQLPGQLIGLGC